MPTATIYAPDDTWIQDASPSTNYNNYEINVGAFTYKSTTINRALVKPDVSSIPAGSIISAASYIVAAPATGSYSWSGGAIPLTAYRAAADWVETTVTWGTKPGLSTVVGSGSYPSPVSANQQFTLFSTLAAAFQNWVDNTWPRHGLVIAATNEATPISSMIGAVWVNDEQVGQQYGNGGIRPYFAVTYGAAPGAPGSITVPAASGVYDASIALFAGQATDPDTPQASLQYEWSYSANGGTSWTVIAGLTAAGTTAKTWDTSALAEGANYKVRIRAWDGTQFGPYTTMAGTFSIQHTAMVKYWNGTAWVLKKLQRWNGSAWVNTVLKRWDGTAWQRE